MREILFRGKRLGDNEWVEGSLFIDDNGEKYEICIGYVNYRITWEVDPETVGQYVGRTDKTGKKIFEGDIIVLHGKDLPYWYEDGQKAVVEYDRSGFLPLCEYDSDRCTYASAEECEVIGNIFDNPDLLEGGAVDEP